LEFTSIAATVVCNFCK